MTSEDVPPKIAEDPALDLYDQAVAQLDQVIGQHFFDLGQLADRLGWGYRTARSANARARAHRAAGTAGPGDLPAPDRHFGWGRSRRPLWLRSRVEHWARYERPGQGFGGGLKRDDAAG